MAASTRNVGKTSEVFISPTARRIDWRSGLCNSPGEALHNGAKSAALQPPVRGDLGRDKQTNKQTHTEYQYYYIRFSSIPILGACSFETH